MIRALFVAAAGALILGTGGAATPPKPFSYHYKTKYAEVQFSWSAEAAAIPRLVTRLRAELAKAKADTVSGGRQEYKLRKIGWETVTKITTSGQTPQLLSLSRLDWEFTGGAHGNGGTGGLLWDRRLQRKIEFGTLFSSPTAYVRLLRGPYCRALDAERRKRRGGELGSDAPGEFTECPALSNLALIPADEDHDGRFDHVHLIAPPYLAGSYAEGEYDVPLPVTRQLIAVVKAAYRASFEAQRQ